MYCNFCQSHLHNGISCFGVTKSLCSHSALNPRTWFIITNSLLPVWIWHVWDKSNLEQENCNTNYQYFLLNCDIRNSVGEVRWSYSHHIIIVAIAMVVRWDFYMESVPRLYLCILFLSWHAIKSSALLVVWKRFFTLQHWSLWNWQMVSHCEI